MLGAILATAAAWGRGALSFLLGNPFARWALVGLAALVLLHHMEGRAYDRGVAAARAECSTAALQSQVDELKHQKAASDGALDKAAKRASAAEQQARLREQAADRAIRLARQSKNASNQCIDKETVDAIRSIR